MRFIPRGAIADWQDDPTVQTIKTFSMPVTEVEYPALTFCRPNLDAGDYTRAVFNNLHFVEECQDCPSQKADKLRYVHCLTQKNNKIKV